MLANRLRYPTLSGLLLLFVTVGVWSEDTGMQTGWMELVKGYQGSEVGVQLVDIEAGDTADTQKITLAIPKESIDGPGEIEEVLVVGSAPEKSEPLDVTYEWVSDYDSENYGLVIRLGSSTNWPIRLYFNSSPGYMR